jgi:hypothetical protein
MQEQKITYKLARVTPRTMRSIEPLVEFKDGSVMLKGNQATFWSNIDNVKLVCSTCFEEDFDKLGKAAWDEMDLDPIKEGFRNFLSKSFSS